MVWTAQKRDDGRVLVAAVAVLTASGHRNCATGADFVAHGRGRSAPAATEAEFRRGVPNGTRRLEQA